MCEERIFLSFQINDRQHGVAHKWGAAGGNAAALTRCCVGARSYGMTTSLLLRIGRRIEEMPANRLLG